MGTFPPLQLMTAVLEAEVRQLFRLQKDKPHSIKENCVCPPLPQWKIPFLALSERHEEGMRKMNAGGLVEMHAHILPGMDDGSKSVEMSIEMLHRLAEMGVAEVCATSHYYAGQNSVTMYLERRAMALEQLREAVGAQDDLPCILPAAEVAYFRGVEEHHPERLCIENTGP